RHARNAVPKSDIGIVYRKPIELFGRCSLESRVRFAHETIEEHQKPVELRHRRSWHVSGDILGCEFGCKGHLLSPVVYWYLTSSTATGSAAGHPFTACKNVLAALSARRSPSACTVWATRSE